MHLIIALLLIAGDPGKEQEIKLENEVLVQIYETKHLHHGVIVKRSLVTYRHNRVRADRMQALYVYRAVSQRDMEEAVMQADTASLDYQRAVLSEREAGLRLKHVRLLAAHGKKIPLPDTDDESLDRDEGPPK